MTVLLKENAIVNAGDFLVYGGLRIKVKGVENLRFNPRKEEPPIGLLVDGNKADFKTLVGQRFEIENQ